MARVELQNLARIFRPREGTPVQALENFSLSVADGELLALVGPSGCGKTTTLRLIAGLDRPDSGAIFFDGQPVTDLPARLRDVALVFQSPALYPHLSVAANITFGLKLRGVARPERLARLGEISALLGLDALLGRAPQELSGGEGQRVALARALIRRPRVLLLDEPLAHLDPPAQAAIRREILALQKRTGVTMVHVTHDQAEALAVGQRVAVMNRGGLEQVAAPAELYRSPANRFVAGFIGSPPMNLIRGTVRIEAAGIIFHESGTDGRTGFCAALAESAAAFQGRPIFLGLRPEAIQIAAPGCEGTVPATVDSIEKLGWETRAHIQTQFHHLISRQVGKGAAEAGPAGIKFDPADAIIFE
jgi:multiple sugar transport system ATP-binding protein